MTIRGTRSVLRDFWNRASGGECSADTVSNVAIGPWDGTAGFERGVLSNGLEIIAAPFWKARCDDVVFLSVVLHVGINQDQAWEGCEGIACLAQTLFKLQADNLVQNNQWQLDCFDSVAGVAYNFAIPRQRLFYPSGIGMLEDIFLDHESLFVLFEDVRGELLSEWTVDDAEIRMNSKLSQKIFGAHWLTRYPLGWEFRYDGVNRVRKKDVEEFLRELCHPGNMSIIAHGIGYESLEHLLSKSAFGQPTSGKVVSRHYDIPEMRHSSIIRTTIQDAEPDPKERQDYCSLWFLVPRISVASDVILMLFLNYVVSTRMMTWVQGFRLVCPDVFDSTLWSIDIYPRKNDMRTDECGRYFLSAVHAALRYPDSFDRFQSITRHRLVAYGETGVFERDAFSHVVSDVLRYKEAVSASEMIDTLDTFTLESIRESLGFLRRERCVEVRYECRM